MTLRELVAKLAAWGGPNTDKVLHFVGGAVVGVVLAWAFRDGRAAILGAIAAGALKELYDGRHTDVHTVDWRGDFPATVLGGVLVWGLW